MRGILAFFFAFVALLAAAIAGLHFSGAMDIQRLLNSPASSRNTPQPPRAQNVPITPELNAGQPAENREQPPPAGTGNGAGNGHSNPPPGPRIDAPENLAGPDFVDPHVDGLPREWTNPKDGMVMVLVPGATFVRGSNDFRQRGREQPLQKIFVDGFYIAKYAVSRAQFQTFIDAKGYDAAEFWAVDGVAAKQQGDWEAPDYWTEPRFSRTPNLPVVGVSWYEADAYAHWAGGQLPSEVQWEKAARGTDGRLYPWGNEWNPAGCNWHDISPDDHRPVPAQESGVADSFPHLAPVDAFADAASPYGAVQMAGNVWEWCRDWLDDDFFDDDVRNSPTLHFNPVNDFSLEQAMKKELHNRVLKGGSFTDGPDSCLASYRHGAMPHNRFYTCGFRYMLPLAVVREALAK